LRILLQYSAFKLISASLQLKSKKGALDTVDRLQALTPGEDQNTLSSDIAAMVPLSPWLKKDEAETK
jgi:hypothetical protein